MKRSLQRHLSLMLGGTILLTCLVAAIASFALAYSEAKEFQDDMLQQSAALNSEDGVAQKTPQSSRKLTLKDPESSITIIHLPGKLRPYWLTADLLTSFHTRYSCP